MLERNITNENSQKKNLDSRSYVVKKINFVRSVREEDNKHLLLESKKGNKEESNFFESNFNNLEFNIFGIHSHFIDENKSHHPSESLPLEEVFLKQKEKIKIYKERSLKKLNKNNKNNDLINNENNDNNKYNIYNNLGDEKSSKSQNNIISNRFKVLTLENYQLFEKTNFETKNKYSSKDESIPILKNVEWTKINKPMENIEFKKLAMRTINEINYETNMVQICINFDLKGESEFWIFTRSFINKEINESINSDPSSINNSPDLDFNKYSSLIKIIKDKNCNKSFITFGTFCKSSRDPNKVSYKIFLKRQIINFNESDNLFENLENDVCEFKVIITDWGEENIEAKIIMNEDKKYNYIFGNFYLPTNKRSKILFCGEGESVIVKKLIINNLNKNEEQIKQFETILTLEQKSCTCCNIF